MKQKLRPDSNMRTVFLVPGIAGSRIQYNYDSSAPSANPACKTSSGGWEDAWVRISALIPITSQCVFTRLSMIFNGKSLLLSCVLLCSILSKVLLVGQISLVFRSKSLVALMESCILIQPTS